MCGSGIKERIFITSATIMSEVRKEIYTYKAPWPIYAMGWSSRADTHSSQYRLAVCSYVEKYSNQVQIICKSGSKKNSYQPQVTYNSSSAVENKMSVDEDDDFSLLCTFYHPYPCTKVTDFISFAIVSFES